MGPAFRPRSWRPKTSPSPELWDQGSPRALRDHTGAPCRNRTDDTGLTMAVLCRLS
jgi:hypothetical protein